MNKIFNVQNINNSKRKKLMKLLFLINCQVGVNSKIAAQHIRKTRKAVRSGGTGPGNPNPGFG